MSSCFLFIMVALWNRADHYIFILFLSSFFLSSFFISSPNPSGQRLDVYHTSTHGVALIIIITIIIINDNVYGAVIVTMVTARVHPVHLMNLECRSEMCCTWLTENTRRKNDAKNRHLDTIPQFCRAISSQLRHVSTIGKKTC